MENLEGRRIEDVPFSGLLERLSQIVLMCEVTGQAKDDLTKEDLISVLAQISEKVVEGMAFTGATREEISYVRDYLLSGMSIGREQPN